MAILISVAKGTLKDSFKHQSEQLKTTADKIQIIIGLGKHNNDSVPIYSICNDWDYANKKIVGFKDMTGERIDLMNKEELSKANFSKFIGKIATEKSFDPLKTEIFVLYDIKEKKLGILLYHNMQFIKPITFEYFFGEEQDS